MREWLQGIILEQKEWSKDLYSLYVQAPINAFIAGQFTQLALEKDGEKIFRPYSFVNAPYESVLEFYYNLIPEGEFTPLLHSQKQGSPIWIAPKPSGRFVLSEVESAQVLWLFATGTGLGVFLSMLKTPQPWAQFQHIVLVHSVHFSRGLTHQDLLHSFSQKYPQQFHWVPVVTKEKHQGAYEQRITSLLTKGVLEQDLGQTLSPQNSQVMLCGNPQMISDMTNVLQERGLKLNKIREKGQITVENYWKLEN